MDIIERIREYIPKGDGYNDIFAHDMHEAADTIETLRQQLADAQEEINCAEVALEAGLVNFPDAPTDFECIGKMADELVRQHRTVVSMITAAPDVRVPEGRKWQIYVESTPTPDDAKRELGLLVDGVSEFAGHVVMLVDENGKCPAVTGCGPEGLRNAEQIVAAMAAAPASPAADERVRELEAAAQLAIQAIGPSLIMCAGLLSQSNRSKSFTEAVEQRESELRRAQIALIALVPQGTYMAGDASLAARKAEGGAL